MRRHNAHALFQRLFADNRQNHRFAAVVIIHAVARLIGVIGIIRYKALLLCELHRIGNGFALGFGMVQKNFVVLAKIVCLFHLGICELFARIDGLIGKLFTQKLSFGFLCFHDFVSFSK